MRRILLIVLTAALALPLAAQNRDVVNIVMADRNKLAGCEGPYRFDAPALTPAPKGYTPFYISHYGRHGSRYAWNANTYTVIKNMLDAAAAAGSLTPRGERLLKDYNDFVTVPQINAGDLSDLGYEQHREIAKIMANSFPEVFANGGHVFARSSTSQRAIVSMNAFTVSLQQVAPKVDITANSRALNMVVINAASAPRAVAKRYQGSTKTPESLDAFKARTIDFDGILDKIFSDRGFMEESGGRTQFLSELFTLWAGYHNYTDSDFLEDIFTPEQQFAFWEIENYSCYLSHGGQRYTQISLLQDVIDLANSAIAGNGNVADLRFGHDTVMNAFYALLNINGAGYEPDKVEDLKYWFQNYNTPMAANVQFVLYRSKKNPEILFKLLHNGAEVTLPQIQPVDGPYYRWSDFTAWASKLAAEHPLLPAAPASASSSAPARRY
ncbi:MAG: hypothetical protein II730_09940 [Bacteroidales bacterium]|nr:hypothetical protein [Bacteroidales bacterium]